MKVIRSIFRGVQSAILSPEMTVALGEPVFRLLGKRKNAKGLPHVNCRRILVVRLDEIGDVVLCSAFLRELRRNFPCATITLIVKPATRNLVELCPYVDEVLTFDWRAINLRTRHLRALWMAVKRCWPHSFDL